jgi:glutamyl/glutaminyl-tRNA synthetase
MEEKETGTKYLRMRMTKEEEDALRALPMEEQEAFMEQQLVKKQRTSFKSVVLAQLMLENIDDMESFGMNQGKVKVTVRQFKVHMNNFLNRIFGKGKISDEDTHVLTKISAEIEKVIDDNYDEIQGV